MNDNEQQIDESNQQLADLTADLQRTRADFENYRKRSEQEKVAARENGAAATILKLLPVIDTIERATGHMPEDLQDNKWAQGIANVAKNLDKTLENLNLKRIEAAPGTDFDPQLHEAIQFDEDAVGDKEIIAEELQAGYTLNSTPIRHSMVKVTKK
jgi:molecular chaperone GrpE